MRLTEESAAELDAALAGVEAALDALAAAHGGDPAKMAPAARTALSEPLARLARAVRLEPAPDAT